MSLSAEWYSDWAHPYPFRVCNVQSEHDPELGQWCVQFALLGIAVEFTWVYDPDTPLRTDLRDMMADESWLKDSRVSMAYPDYEKMRDAAAKWEASQK